MKRPNSLPLSPVVLTWPYCREIRYLQVLRSTVTLNSYLGFSALCKSFFALCIKFDKGGNSLHKHFECNPNICSNLWISLLSRNQTNTKRTRKIFLQLGPICFRILSRQFENLSVFCKFFLKSLFATWWYRFIGTSDVNQRALKLPSISHTRFLTRQIFTKSFLNWQF